jgi:hypothetical protein
MCTGESPLCGTDSRSNALAAIAQRQTGGGFPHDTFSTARVALLGAAIATSMGIGYAIGAQPHMNESIAFLHRTRRTSGGDAEQGRSSGARHRSN